MELLHHHDYRCGHKPELRKGYSRSQPLQIRIVNRGEASPKQGIHPDVCTCKEIRRWEYSREELKTCFDYPPGENCHRQKERHSTCPLGFYRQQQHRPEQVEVFLNRKS